VYAKKFTAERLKLENSVKTTKWLFYYLKLIQKFQILKKVLKLLLFFHRHPSGRRMFPGQPWYHPTAQRTMAQP
jgi:hypothetical protein